MACLSDKPLKNAAVSTMCNLTSQTVSNAVKILIVLLNFVSVVHILASSGLVMKRQPETLAQTVPIALPATVLEELALVQA